MIGIGLDGDIRRRGDIGIRPDRGFGIGNQDIQIQRGRGRQGHRSKAQSDGTHKRETRIITAGTHEYAKFIKPSELAGWIRDAGLTLTEMTGLLYNPITKHYRLDQQDVSVNYMVRAVKPA